MDPFLTFSDERELREKVWRTYYSRGDNGDEHDNNAIIAEILQLRHERVQLWATTTTPSGGSRTAWPRRPSARSS